MCFVIWETLSLKSLKSMLSSTYSLTFSLFLSEIPILSQVLPVLGSETILTFRSWWYCIKKSFSPADAITDYLRESRVAGFPLLVLCNILTFFLHICSGWQEKVAVIRNINSLNIDVHSTQVPWEDSIELVLDRKERKNSGKINEKMEPFKLTMKWMTQRQKMKI
jgi:hypothetical protein